MNRKSFFSQGFKLLKGQMIDQSVPQNVKAKMEEIPFRPLGVKNEEDFVSKCTSCEDCVPACPQSVIQMVIEYDKIKRPQLSDPSQCMSCKEKSCILSCTSNALSNEYIHQIAQIIFNSENCISYNGSMCRVCYDYCPEKGNAIVLDQFIPIFNDEHCTACNKCSEICVTGDKTIVIKPYDSNCSV